MDPTSLTSLSGYATAGGNIVSTILSNIFNRRMQRENNALQRQLAAQANQWNIDQWMRENAYNTPSAQMARLRAAGLNPSLAMTSGDIANEAAASPQANIANTQASHNIAPQIDPLTAAQIANINADTDQKKAQTDTEASKKVAQDLDNMLKQININLAQMDEDVKRQVYDDGTLAKAYRAALNNEVFSSGLTRNQYVDSCWSLAATLNADFASTLANGMPKGTEIISIDGADGKTYVNIGDGLLFASFNRSREQFIHALTQSGLAAEDAANVFNAALARLNADKLKGEADFYKWLKDLIGSKKRGDRILGYILYGASYLAENMAGRSPITLNFSRRNVFNSSERTIGTLINNN